MKIDNLVMSAKQLQAAKDAARSIYEAEKKRPRFGAKVQAQKDVAAFRLSLNSKG